MTQSFANLKRLLLHHEDRIVADAEAILAEHGIPDLHDEGGQPLGTVQQALRGPRSIHHFAMPLLDALTDVTGDDEAAIAAQDALQKQWHIDRPPAAGLLTAVVSEHDQLALLSGMLARHAAQARAVHLFARFPRNRDAFEYAVNHLFKMKRSKGFRKNRAALQDAIEDALDRFVGIPSGQPRPIGGWQLETIQRLTAPTEQADGPRRWKNWHELSGWVARGAGPRASSEVPTDRSEESRHDDEALERVVEPAIRPAVPGTSPWIVEPYESDLENDVGLAVDRIQGLLVALQHGLAADPDPFAPQRVDHLTSIASDLLPLKQGDLLTGRERTSFSARWAYANIAIGAVAGRPPATVAEWLNQQLGTSAWSERNVVTRHINRIAQISCPQINADRWRRHVKVDNHMVDWRSLLLLRNDWELFTVPRVHNSILDTYIEVLADSLLADDDPGWRNAIRSFRRGGPEMDLVAKDELPAYAVRQIAARILAPTEADITTANRLSTARERTDMLGVRFHRLLLKKSEHDHACPCETDTAAIGVPEA